MNEQQVERMIELLEKILSELETVSSNTSTVYDLGDVCSKLDDVKRAVEKLDR